MGGIVITPGNALVLAELVEVAIITIAGDANIALNAGVDTALAGDATIYRPPQWATGKQKYSIVVPQTSTTGNPNDVTASTQYVFDAMMEASHSSHLDVTKYPVQTGYNAAYNAVLKAKRVVLVVEMSDAVDQYQAGMWVGGFSKSINAFQTMLNIQALRQFLTVNTRLYQYTNMMLIDISSRDSKKTRNGLDLVLEFEQLFVDAVTVQGLSARPNVTDSNQLAQIPSTDVPSSLTNINKVDPAVGDGGSFGVVQAGASSLDGNFGTPPNIIDLQNTYGVTQAPGLWSSNPTATIPATLGGGS
jgi:hypothetical protein